MSPETSPHTNLFPGYCSPATSWHSILAPLLNHRWEGSGWETDYVVSVYPPPPHTIHPHQIATILEESEIVLRWVPDTLRQFTTWYRSKLTVEMEDAVVLAPSCQSHETQLAKGRIWLRLKMSSSWPPLECLQWRLPKPSSWGLLLSWWNGLGKCLCQSQPPP